MRCARPTCLWAEVVALRRKQNQPSTRIPFGPYTAFPDGKMPSLFGISNHASACMASPQLTQWRLIGWVFDPARSALPPAK